MTNPTPQPPAPTPNVSETPRTDELAFVWTVVAPRAGKAMVSADFARQLERELAAVTKEWDEWKTMALKLDAAVLAEQVDHVKTCGFLDATKAQLTAAIARAEKAEPTPHRTSKEYFADHDAFVAYVLDEVNPARKAEGLDTCSAGLAEHLFRVMSERRHRP